MANCPDVRFHIETAAGFFAYDRHGDGAHFFAPWGDPFVCRWDQSSDALEGTAACGVAGTLRVSINGVLQPTTGELAWRDARIARLTTAAQGLVRVFAGTPLFDGSGEEWDGGEPLQRLLDALTADEFRAALAPSVASRASEPAYSVADEDASPFDTDADADSFQREILRRG